MPYVVTEECIKCKYMDCVEPCPVDCFYEGENMLVIHPDECIDCAACELMCPVEAIVSDDHPRATKWKDLNRECSANWPKIVKKGEPPQDAGRWDKIPNKFADHFSPRPGVAHLESRKTSDESRSSQLDPRPAR